MRLHKKADVVTNFCLNQVRECLQKAQPVYTEQRGERAGDPYAGRTRSSYVKLLSLQLPFYSNSLCTDALSISSCSTPPPCPAEKAEGDQHL